MLQTAASLAAALFERLDDNPFFVKDAALCYVAANPAMARLCGASGVTAMLGRRAAAFFPRAEAERYERLDAEVLATGQPITDRLDHATAGRGQAAWLLFSRIAVRDDGGRIVGVAASARRLGDAERRQPVYARLARAVARLEAQLEEPFDLDGLARECGISPAQIERDFRAAFGLAPRSFLHKLRIDRALALLAGPDSVAAIAQACGFSDHSAFTRRFREMTGTSPTAWRQQQKASQ